jgi:putative ABC transport system permease protein
LGNARGLARLHIGEGGHRERIAAVMVQRLAVVRYRLRATFRRRWGWYLSLVVLVGLVAGLGLGSLAAARRTQSSFSTFLASTNPSEFTVSVYGGGAAAGNPDYDPALTTRIAELPGVRRVGAAVELTGAPLTSDGSPRLRVTGEAFPVASINGLLFTQDRVAVTQGHMASPDQPDQIMMAPLIARQYGFHVGQVIPFGFYSDAQQNLPGFGTKAVPPALRVNMKLVGLALLNSEIVEDDVDTLPTLVPLTPAFAREVLAQRGEQFTGALIFGIQTRNDPATVSAVEREVAALIPTGVISTDHALAPVVDKADRSLKPISIALGVFGAISLLAALLIAAQLIARRFRADGGELQVLRAIGAGPPDTMLDGLIGTEVSILLGSLLAVGVAVALSPLAPLGPVRPVYPTGGVAFDWTVLGFGAAALVVLLSAAAVLLAYATAPHRTALPPHIRPTSGARIVTTLARAGLPAPGVVGVRMALEPGEGRGAVPVRSALLGSLLAVTLVITTLTFGNSLDTLISSPALYGWNWTYILNPVGAGDGNVPNVALSMLRHDPYVAAASGVSYNNAEIDGQVVPFLVANAGAAVAPPVLSGHGLEAAHEIVLGAATMAQLHKRLGQYVTLTYGTPSDAPVYIPPTRLLIVGTATFPAIGFASTVSDHTSMGTGALFALQGVPSAFRSAINGSSDPALNGPNLVLVRIRANASPAASLASLQPIVAASNRVYATALGSAAGNALVVQGVQRPAEIVNYRSIGLTPTLLVSGLALGAIVALALTLVASVRQRRRDLALLKTIGFARRQLAASVAWQASVVALLGAIVGIPLGVVAGRWLWDLFARQIYAVPYPTVSVPAVALVAVGALVLANLIALVPAWNASRTPTALALRAE